MEQDKDAVALPETLDKKDQEETWDEPTPKGRQISLSLKKKCATSGSRFASPTKVSVLEKAAKGVVPGNTLQSTRWAVNTFITWAKQRNKRMPEEQIELDGDKYLPSSIRSLLSGIGRELADNKVPYNTLDGNDHRFQDLNCTLDTINSQLHHDGVGVSVKKAEVITKEVEQLCWDKGPLGFSSPTVLQHTIFFYLGLHFVLRGVQEQHDLLVKQLQRIPSDYSVFNNSVYYEYTEFISKNNLHRFSDHRMKNKVVKAYAQPQSSHCLVLLLDNYLPLLPEDTLHIYMCPLQKFPCTELAPAYAKQRVGVNTLKRFLSMITSGAGLSGYTNHSLCVTAVSRMYNSGVPEKIIAERSGHRSLDALRSYEHTEEELCKEAEQSIVDPDKKFQNDVKVKSENKEDSNTKEL